MIVLDIETSGLFPEKCGIWQIGALDSDNPSNQFLGECRIDSDDEISEGALKVCDKTEAQLHDSKKQSQKELIEKFFNWTKTIKIKNIISQSPQILDFSLIAIKARKYKLELPYNYRCFDMHSLARLKYFQVRKNFLIKDFKSDMGLSSILSFCGLQDERIKMENDRIKEQGKPHNAVEDAKLTAECFSRIVYGKNLLKEFTKFPVPDYLK